MLSMSARSPSAHRCFQMARCRTSPLRPSMARRSLVWIGTGGRKLNLSGFSAPEPVRSRRSARWRSESGPSASSLAIIRPHPSRMPPMPWAGARSSIQPRQYLGPKWKHIVSSPVLGCVYTNGSMDNCPFPAAKSSPTPDTNQSRLHSSWKSGSSADKASLRPRKSVSPSGIACKKCIVCAAKGARNMTPSTCQPLVPTDTKPLVSSFDTRNSRGSGALGCGRCSPWSRDPRRSLNAMWSAPVNSVCPRKTSKRYFDTSARNLAIVLGSWMASRTS
mmetsp:Transcript_53304/g.148229  ORF Transcript_53304/g.148229 Transcript_53304/m.148229 type:complete len:276 (-) Transcript_53304:401-1228(-)